MVKVSVLRCWRSVRVAHARVGLLGESECNGDGDLPRWVVRGGGYRGQRRRGVPYDH